MVQVDIEKLEEVLSRYSKIVEEYETCFFAIEREYNIIRENWQSPKMQQFYKQISDQQVETKKVMLSLREYLEVLKSIDTRYKELGTKIECNLESKEKILKNIDICLNDFNKVITQTSSLSSSPKISNRTHLSYEVEKLKSAKEEGQMMRQEIASYYEKVENIEYEIHAKLQEIGGE